MEVAFDRGGKKPSKMEATAKISGKKKLNAVQLDTKTILCTIYIEYSKQTEEKKKKHYQIRSFMSKGKLIEINTRVIENPRLLVTDPEGEGFLAIVQFGKESHLQNCVNL